MHICTCVCELNENILAFGCLPVLYTTFYSKGENDLKQKNNFFQNNVKRKKVEPRSRLRYVNKTWSVAFVERSPVRERWSCEQL